MWEKPDYEIIDTCCEIGAYVYTDDVKKKLSDESDANIESSD
jgi:coenzyme PQQ precursor peptide PqqA